METPLSSRRITRSQAKTMVSENTIRGENEELSNKFGSRSIQKTKNQEREKSALIDITNGSPIVGLAMGCLKTPSSTCSKNKRIMIQSKQGVMTPGSGESILRGQVKTLLQKVEEEGVISKISFERNPLIHKRFINSPIAVLAPTPANTPQVYDFSTNNNNASGAFFVSPVAENFSFSQMLNEIIVEPNQEEKSESDEKIVITRSLFVDFSENFEGCDDSPVEGGSDASSVWSVQVNASTSEEYKDEEEEEYEDGDDVVVDELCEGISKISVKNDDAKFIGKHIRFLYNSDGELEGEIESSSSSSNDLATPEGKHLRFSEEYESEEEEEEEEETRV